MYDTQRRGGGEERGKGEMEIVGGKAPILCMREKGEEDGKNAGLMGREMRKRFPLCFKD